jgi:hypothetical protein
MTVSVTTDPLRELKIYGRDMAAIPLSRLPTTFNKVAFLCVNTYRSYRLDLGTGPITDALALAKCVKLYGFEIYFMHNPHARNFLKYLDTFFANTTGQLLVYYVGHGAGVLDVSEAGEEAFVFDDGILTDDDLVSHLIENKNPSSKLILVTDACHSGTIWDIQGGAVKGKKLPPQVLSLSASTGTKSLKTTTLNKKDQGIFTTNLTKTIAADPWINPSTLQGKMKAILKKYSQTFIVGTSSPNLLTRPLFS